MADSSGKETSSAASETCISKVSILGRESIHLGFHLIPYIVSTVLKELPSSTYVLITDSHLAKIHLPPFQSTFQDALCLSQPSLGPTARFLYYEVPPGEQSKSRQTKADIEDWLLRQRCTRDIVILALGGGVVGDLTGFVSATFMRGVRYCQIPTTLLAMVDSAVGGKTAIDTPLGKNLIGAFHQPAFVFIDAAFLETLPEREFVNGMAEIIKTAAIWSEDEFVALEQGVDTIRSAVLSGHDKVSTIGRSLSSRTESQKLLLSVIQGSIAVKAHIVTEDEKETGLRNLVNFGHTIGHAIEAVLTPDILHGECVSVGMVLEAEVARALGVLSNAAVARLSRCLASHGLPISIRDKGIAKTSKAKNLTVETLMDVMKVDKKNLGKQKKVVLLSAIGKTYEAMATAVADDVIAKVIAPDVQIFPGLADAKHDVILSTPGSKSISNRALILAALGQGVCRIRNLLHSDDTQVMMTALTDMRGATFTWEDNGETLVVQGGGGALQFPSHDKEIYLGNAGTAARFLTTVCTLVQPDNGRDTQGKQKQTVITGNARMKERPIGDLVTALRDNGSLIDYLDSEGCLPLSIPSTGFKGGKIQLTASVSSQYVSSILLSAPYAQEQVLLELTEGVVISQPYIDMTIAMMRSFGVRVERLTEPDKARNTYRIPRAVYQNPQNYDVESDASSATYPLAIAAITGSTCTISNIGSASLQGDAKFAKRVLEPMGCKVIQTPRTTTVTGPPPGHLRALGVVDMEVMTDAFLTASCLAAVAFLDPLSSRERDSAQLKNSTRIVGIANQRVKECNRIKAMMDELKKFNVETKELDDGLEIFGRAVDGLVRSAPRVHCYEDHRVAMAFSVLATVPGGPGAVLEDRRCVEKTWPSWWDDLSGKLGIQCQGIQLPIVTKAQRQVMDKDHNRGVPLTRYSRDATVLIIGMKGAEKSQMGKIAAAALERTLIDADEALSQKLGRNLKEFIDEKGLAEFRVEELRMLKEILESKPIGHIISLGGEVIDIPEARKILLQWIKEKGPVLSVVRDIDEVMEFSESERSTPSSGESLPQIYERRKSSYEACSSYKFVTGHTPFTKRVNGHSHVNKEPQPILARRVGSQRDTARFFRFITGQQKPTLDLMTIRTSFLALTFPDLTPALSIMDQITVGVDAIELRTDLLSPSGNRVTEPTVPPRSYVALQLAQLRQTTDLPIVYTVRTYSQGGMFPDDKEDEMFELLQLGIRLGCEYVDVECGWDSVKTKALVDSKGYSTIIASYHDWSGNLRWDSDEVVQKYQLARKHGDIVKIVSKALSLKDNFAMMAFRDRMPDDVPLMTINMGTQGQLSRILNPVFTPVTHPLLPGLAAPGQLTYSEVQQGLYLIGQIPKKSFFLFGSPIMASQSPLIHNTGFKSLGLPHHYDRHETDHADERLRQLIRSPDFGGASVTIPLKLDVIPLLDGVSEHAKQIGAVNTIIPSYSETAGTFLLIGENTDWLAIVDLTRKNLSFSPSAEPSVEENQASCLVIGAGGTSRAAIYAMHQLGFRIIYLFNRTPANIVKVIETFPKAYNIVPLTSFESFPLGLPSVVVSTLPPAGTTRSKFAVASGLDAIYLPDSILAKEPAGVVIDMAYKPRLTPLVEIADSKGWARVTGIEILLQQAFHQFRLWTNKKPPETVITETVMPVYNSP